MLELVDVGPRGLRAYRGVAPDAVLDDLVRHAEGLRGARVLNVNATPYGGGVSELLRSGVPILDDLGLIAHWQSIRGNDRFFQVTKKVHNGLQGAAGGLAETEREALPRDVATQRRRRRRHSSDAAVRSRACHERHALGTENVRAPRRAGAGQPRRSGDLP